LSVTGSVVFDVGTGDGLYVYRAARSNPNNFYVGIDCNSRPLEKISEKAFRKPAKGGAPNLLYLLAAVESLPSELEGIANEIHILFPWGSLLRAVALGEREILEKLKRISAPNASMQIVIAFDPQTDKNKLARLEIESLSLTSIRETLVPRYEAAGLTLISAELLSQINLKTTWAQRLRQNPARVAFQIVARAAPPAGC